MEKNHDAHFERIGAEKMREQAVAVFDDQMPREEPKAYLAMQLALQNIRAISLHPQTTTNTEEASQ